VFVALMSAAYMVELGVDGLIDAIGGDPPQKLSVNDIPRLGLFNPAAMYHAGGLSVKPNLNSKTGCCECKYLI
jgi:hypothetical protein